MAEDLTAVSVVRSMYRTWNARDLDGFVAALDPEVEWRTFDVGGFEHSLKGREQVRRFHLDLIERLGWVEFELAKVRQVGDRVTVELVPATTEGAAAPAPQSPVQPTAVWTIRDGVPVAFRLFISPEAAAAQEGEPPRAREADADDDDFGLAF